MVSEDFRSAEDASTPDGFLSLNEVTSSSRKKTMLNSPVPGTMSRSVSNIESDERTVFPIAWSAPFPSLTRVRFVSSSSPCGTDSSYDSPLVRRAISARAFLSPVSVSGVVTLKIGQPDSSIRSRIGSISSTLEADSVTVLSPVTR